MLMSFFATISISFFIMGGAGLITEAIQKSKFFEDISYIRFIRNEQLNDLLGVGIIKWFVTKTFWSKFNPKIRLDGNSGVDKLKAVRHEMTKGEVGHTIAWLLQMVIAPIIGLTTKNHALMWFLIIANYPLNVLPLLLQQRNKARIDKVLRRLLVTSS